MPGTLQGVPSSAAAPQACELTAREREVARLVALGMTNRQIAEALVVTDGTATTHVKHILRKLDLARRSQIASFAVESGWLVGTTGQGDRPGSPSAADPIDPTDPVGIWHRAGAGNLRGTARSQTASSGSGTALLRPFGRPYALVATIVVGIAACVILLWTAHSAAPRESLVSPVGLSPTGDLVYAARLSGASDDLLGDPFHGPSEVDGEAVVVRTPPAAIEIEVRRPGGSTGVALDAPPLSRYRAELDLAFAPGSDMTFFWNVRWLTGNRDANVLRIEIQAASESLQLVEYRSGRERNPVTHDIEVPALQSGRTFTVTVIADGEDYRLLLDAAPVADFTGGRSVRPTRPEFGGFGSGGALRVLGARVYSLESQRANVPATAQALP